MIGVIADDLTGAAELGAVGVRHGLKAEVLIWGSGESEEDLVCVDTDSRSSPAAEAAVQAGAAADELVRNGATHLYKKVDSVLRGNVLAELEAMRRHLGLARVLLVPANPSLGRVIRNGQYYIHGLPIHETDFRFDPEYPRTTASVHEMLGAGSAVGVQLVRLSESLPAGGILVGEAESTADLRQWVGRLDARTLAAGGAEFFAATLEARGSLHACAAGVAVAPANDRELFICGTSNLAARGFAEELRQRGVPVISLPHGLAVGVPFPQPVREQIAAYVCRALASNRRVMLDIGLPQVKQTRVAAGLARHLTDLAAAILTSVSVGQVFVEGGATAAALIRGLGWTRLSVVRELAPGVVTLRTAADPSRLVTIKPGSYAWPIAMRS